MPSLLTELLTAETIPYLPLAVQLIVLLLLIYKAIYKEDRNVKEKLSGIPAFLIVLLTLSMQYIDAGILNVFGPIKYFVLVLLQIVAGAVFGAFVALITILGFELIESVIKK